ncbi:hypothetical protein CCMA1212_006791 [Trichoderma ghanense]|uniref:Uncharacterized protein n=1 Tax=Trichoderma ghanense TaxID=65468 RepID=A0ABY2H2I6_9HYPO
MERQSDRRREGSQEPASSNSDLMHTGCQFEEIDIERGVSSSELADPTLPNWPHLEDNDSCGGINDELAVDKASGPESSTDSSAPSHDWKSPLDVVDRDYTVANRSDPWFPIPKWSRTTSTYAKRVAFRFAIRMFDALFASPTKPSEGKPAPSEQTDSAYASMPGDATTACPANWTRQPQVVQPEMEASLTQNAQSMAEVQTVCSDQSSVDSNRPHDYIGEFTRRLYQQIQPLLTNDNVSSAVGLLPDLLSAFALQKGQESQAQVNQDIRYFVYKHRLIIAQLLAAFYETEHASIANPRSDTSLTSVTERIDLIWNRASQKGNSSAPEESPGPFLDVDGEGDSLQDFYHYREAITAGPALQWIVEELRRELSPSTSGLHTMEKISSDILKGLSKDQKISKRHPSRLSKLTFDVACDILAYMEDQGYAMDADEVLPRAITLTGSSTNAQALTIKQYVCQTWPTIKCHLVEAIQAALRVYKAYGYDASKPFQNASKRIVDVGTEVRVSIGEKMMNVEAVGTARSIADIAGQLGWLATTLSSSHRERVISFCHPEISGFSAHSDEEGFDSTFICRVNTETEHLRDNLPSVNGQCWHRLFNNPVVVTGYPIKPRKGFVVEAGLELPFDMMATLSDCQFLTTWEGKTVIKGFSAMLIPTRVQDDIISWHLLVSEAGKRLSYGDDRVPKGISIAPQNLSGSRHVLGWCAEAQNDIGAPGANYNIGWSGLPLAENDVSWGPVTTSFGVGGFFKVSSDFERGNRERIISSFTDNHYGSLVRHIGQQHFLLWDVDEKRGWLTDGSRAHLHLVRASLWEGHREKPNGYCMDQIRKLNELALLKEDAAEVLLDTGNLDAEAERRDPAYTSLNTRMERIGYLVEKTIDQVHKATNIQGTSVGMPVHVLEGFDFMDVATLRDLHLHTLKLPLLESGDGWANIVPHLPVVTLFGKGFGELIKPGANNPTKSCDKCGFVVSLPAGRHLLAVCVDVLEKILRIRGNKDSRPWQLINELYWPTREPVFEPCKCTSTDSRVNNDGRVQMLSKKKPRGMSFSKPIKLERRGAVIFGHSFRLSLIPSRLFLSHDRASSSNISSATQTTNQVPDAPVSATHDESFDTNETPPSDTVSSSTPNTAPWSKTEDLVSNDTTIEQQNQPSTPVCTKTDTLAASPSHIEPSVPAKASRKRSAKRVKEFCAATWKTMKMIKRRKNN